MSLYAYLAGGKLSSSEWLRERLKWDSLRGREKGVDLGVPAVKVGNVEREVGLADYDPVLRAHCRLDEAGGGKR
jgi:hypothetical protein